MKDLGYFALFVGVVWFLVALNMDTTVVSERGGRINNIGLLADKQNHIMIGAFIFLCGLLCVIFGRKGSTDNDDMNCPFCAELIKPQAIKCKHCGSGLPRKSNHRKLPSQPLDSESLALLNKFRYYDFLDEHSVLIDSKIYEFAEVAAAYCDEVVSRSGNRKDAKDRVVTIMKAISSAYDEKKAQCFESQCSEFFTLAVRKLRSDASETLKSQH